MDDLSPPTSPLDAQADNGSIRLYLDAPIACGQTLDVPTPQAHYLTHVMRRRGGDAVRVFNGRDGEYRATLQEARRSLRLVVGDRCRPQADEPDIWMVFALLKRGPTELIVQKATELGVSALQPVFTTRTNADRTNLTRLTAIATEAAEQSERLTVPTVHPPRALSAVLANWPVDRSLIACFERGAELPIARNRPERAAILIGPEGGFTDAELDAVRARPFVLPATLGPRVLRAETAAVVALALLQAE